MTYVELAKNSEPTKIIGRRTYATKALIILLLIICDNFVWCTTLKCVYSYYRPPIILVARICLCSMPHAPHKGPLNDIIGASSMAASVHLCTMCDAPHLFGQR